MNPFAPTGRNKTTKNKRKKGNEEMGIYPVNYNEPKQAEENHELIERVLEEGKNPKDMGEVSDGYHTFNELYYHRMILFAVICTKFKTKAWKSKLHHDGTMYDNFFIVGIKTPEGQYSYHYDIKYWDMFDCKELDNAPEYDGHQPKDVDRLLSLVKSNKS